MGGDLGRRLWRLHRLGAVLALEQRVAQQLGVDEGAELEMAELQQPDRLHELRRQCQRLRLPDLEPRRQRHGAYSRVFQPPRGARRERTMAYSGREDKGEGKNRANTVNGEW